MSYLKRFQLDYPDVAQEMRDCSHHYDEKNLNPYHIEGDIFAHSVLVTKQLEGTDLELPAVLHDIGKLETRYENHEKKRVRFSGHENMSAFLSLKIFNDWELTQEQKERYFKLIAMHGEPYRQKPEDLKMRLVNDEALAYDLYRFGQADHNGRFTEIVDDKHQTIEIIPEEKPPSNFTKEVVFLVGLPGSGKSSYYWKELECYTLVSRDDIVMSYGIPEVTLGKPTNYNQAWNSCDQKKVDIQLNAELQKAAVLRNKVCIDMTNLNRKQRTQKLKFFKDFKKKAIVFLPDMGTLVDRLNGRENKTIPEHVITKMIMGASFPDFQEFDIIEWRFE